MSDRISLTTLLDEADFSKLGKPRVGREDMSEIKPALTSEEWRRFPSWGHSAEPEPGEEPLYHRTRHGIAAANLHEQPFGFTREDVENHRGRCAHLHTCGIHSADVLRLADWHESMADRISALLPPEENHGSPQAHGAHHIAQHTEEQPNAEGPDQGDTRGEGSEENGSVADATT